MKKFDWIIIFLVIIIATSIFVVNIIKNKNDNSNELFVEVYYNGEIYERVNIDEEKAIIIETELGKNVVAIEEGKVYMKESDCKDKVCVRTGSIDKVNRNIVCLPNKVHVQIVGSGEDEIDAIVQ